MNNPLVIWSLPEWTWTKVATSVLIGSIHRLSTTTYYYQTYRKTGEGAPPMPTEGIIPDEAVVMFEKQSTEPISAPETIDVYIMTMRYDGKLRVDV